MTQHGWTFLTNHGQVLLAIVRDREARVREIAEAVGVTERATQKIIKDLVMEGYVTAHRVGRRNRYEVHMEGRLRHPLARERAVGDLLRVLTDPEEASGGERSESSG